MYSGFFNERTAEYTLVPDLSQRLGDAYPRVVPFFYWASFEGQAKARASYEGKVRILCCYARRPKVVEVGDRSVFIKFNELLFSHARLLAPLGIPVLAGAPCVSRLSDLRVGVPCVWFYLQPDEGYETVIHLDLDSMDQCDSSSLQGPLTPHQLCSITHNRAEPIEWSEALNCIGTTSKALQESAGYRALFGWRVRYKPFYLAVFD
jgi:hypothetical protein